jgi:hypothetical protein
MHFNLPYCKGHKSLLNIGPLHTWQWGPMAIALQAHSLVEKMELVQVHFTLHLRDQSNKWMQDGYKVYIDFYMASNGSCFMVTWTIFTNHLLEVGLTQHMALQNLTTIDSLYFIMCENPTWINFHWNSIWLRVSHIWFHTHLKACDHTIWFWNWSGTHPLGSNNFMVMALGLCIKWPLDPWDVQNIS